MNAVFCDDLRVSLPHDSWEFVRSDIADVLADSGFAVDSVLEKAKAGAVGPGAVKVDKFQAWRSGGGTVRSEVMGRVRVLSMSGAALGSLRLLRQFGRLLGTIGSVPHNVTGLHATLDVRAPTPEILLALLAKAESADGLRAGRKRIPVRSLQRYLARLPDGRDTGSIYCGSRGNEIRPVVYDKRQERLDKGQPDLGYDLTRYELRLRGVGASLRDAYEPAGVFWHYMAPDFLERPAEAPEWVAGAEGFSLPPVDRVLPASRLLRRVEASEEFADLVRIAGVFPGGIDYLCDLVRRVDRYGTTSLPKGVQGLAPAGTPSVASSPSGSHAAMFPPDAGTATRAC